MKRAELSMWITALEQAGFDCTISKPDRDWFITIWPKKRPKEGPFEVRVVLRTQWAVVEFIKAVLMGYNTGRS